MRLKRIRLEDVKPIYYRYLIEGEAVCGRNQFLETKFLWFLAQLINI